MKRSKRGEWERNINIKQIEKMKDRGKRRMKRKPTREEDRKKSTNKIN
jgi:hypothetical protein